jgi:hypothetical protein
VDIRPGASALAKLQAGEQLQYIRSAPLAARAADGRRVGLDRLALVLDVDVAVEAVGR